MATLLLRALLLLMGVVFAASLTVAVLLLAAVWAVYAGWAKLTGKPITPWATSMGARFDPRKGFARYREATRKSAPTAADVANARALGESAASPVVRGDTGADNDVTDVQARPTRRGEAS